MTRMTRWSAGAAALALSAWGAALAQSAATDGVWTFGDDDEGPAAWVSTDLGRGVRGDLSIHCHSGRPYAGVNAAPASAEAHERLRAYLDSYMEAELYVETYREGLQTDRFRALSWQASPQTLTLQNLAALQEASSIRVTGGQRSMSFSARRSAAAIGRLIAACPIR